MYTDVRFWARMAVVPDSSDVLGTSLKLEVTLLIQSLILRDIKQQPDAFTLTMRSLRIDTNQIYLYT